MGKEYRAITGLEALWFAKNLRDTKEGAEYDKVIELTNPKTFSVEVDGSVEKGYAGNRAIEAAQVRMGGSISIEMHNMDSELEDIISGAEIDEDGFLVYTDNDKTPYVGVIGKFTKENGEAHYIGATKVLFNPTTDEANTKEDGVEFQSVTIEGELFAREFDGKKKYKARTSDGNFNFEKFINKVFLNAEYSGDEGNEDTGGNNGGDTGGDEGNEDTGGGQTGEYDEYGRPYTGGIGLDGALYDNQQNAVHSPEEVDTYVQEIEQVAMRDLANYKYEPDTGDINYVEYTTDEEGYRTSDVLFGYTLVPGTFTKWYDVVDYPYHEIGSEIPELAPEV